MTSIDKTGCQLCGVTFNINRIRTRSEPRSSAWGNSYTSKHNSREWVALSGGDAQECPDGSCASVYRGRPPGELKFCLRLYEDDPNDASYVYESDEDDEPLEYDSNTEDDDGDEVTEEQNETSSSQSQASDTEEEYKWVFNASGLDPQPEYDTEFLPLSAPYDDEGGAEDEDIGVDHHIMALPTARRYEHIAGPGCCNLRGYHGDRITLDEMIDCHTVQGLYKKTSDWTPSDDDMDFERESKNYHLTGLSDCMPPNGGDVKCAPIRGGADWFHASNLSDTWKDLFGWGTYVLPFHPTCFEIFIRISKQQMGRVSLDSLMKLESTASRSMFGERHPDIVDARNKGWKWACLLDTEYLAANPVFISGFREICDAAISDAEDFDSQSSPFPERPEKQDVSAVRDDPFLKLPTELKHTIAWHLGSKDIASLRMASRAFYHLPMTLWHTLMVREMPWVYEAWCDDPTPYPWAMADASYLKQMREREEAYTAERTRRADVLKANEPDFYPIWEENEPKSPPLSPELEAQTRLFKEKKRAMAPVRLPRERTNWYQLYTDIKANEEKLKGLRNRKRIWGTVGEIVQNVKKCWEAELVEINTPFAIMEVDG
ncbi:hypothetical protein H0G86_001179 [Trichoderma simmonsii]|uniref:F-box domain-containing protein n=2 Tax=Trichoderma simmonsii TaxID=1491479 RepID=A0A8G0PA77_9HYPO|nr:hypothetical protein H0G86_001179 [Trichoderma simmonsii]